ncbi:16690_t:CDS:10 [Funneliformis mosseae]|uniref:dual-specificity kinase n=1 Tax=Funneliformis mosseae TaxID=27381 RepID=A0A9N9GEL1_FUNMO|nr:16690_t:CDS:10 [Funneliformis mosseae]
MQLAPSPVQIHTSLAPSPIVNPKLKSTTKVTKQSNLPPKRPRTRTSSLTPLQAQQQKTQLQQPQKIKKIPTKVVNKEVSPRKPSTSSVGSSHLSNLNCMSPSEVSVNLLDSSQKSSSSRRLSVVSTSSSTSSTLSGQISRHRSQHGNTGNPAINNVPSVPDFPNWLSQPPVRNSTSQQPQQTTSRISSSPHKKSLGVTRASKDENSMTSVSSGQPVRSKSRHKQPKEESKHEPTTGNESKQIKKAKYKAATEEALKRFNDLQMVEHKIASQTNEVMERMKNLFQPKRDDASDEESFSSMAGEDLSGKHGFVGNDKSRRAPSASKRTPTTSVTPVKPSVTRRTSQDSERPTKSSTSASGIDRQRTRTIDSSMLSSLRSSHNRYASENSITTSTERKSLKTARSEERIRSAAEKQKKIEKRKTIDSSIKSTALEQLDRFTSFQDFNSKRRSTFDSTSSPLDFDNGDSHQYDLSPSPLWPSVSKSKTMPITPPPSTLTSKLPPPMPVRSSSYNSSEQFSPSSKNNQGTDNTLTSSIENTSTTSSSSSATMKRRKSKIDHAKSGSPNSPKTTSSRTTTPTTIASHRLSHPPPTKDAQPPPPVPNMPSMLPQPKLTRVNEEIPPVPAIPHSMNSEKKVSISASSKGYDEVLPRGRKDNRSTDGHRPPSSSTKKKSQNRPRGTMSGQQQSDKIIRRQTLPANIAAPQQLAALTLPPMNVQPLTTVKIPKSVNPNLKAKTPTSEHPRSGLRIPTTPTASANTFTKLPTPTGIQSRIIKSGSGIASPSKVNSRAVPVSPNRSYGYASQKSISSNSTLNTYGSSTTTMVITGRKSATTPCKTSTSVDKAHASNEKVSSKSKPRRLSNSFINLFSNKNSHSSASSHAKTIPITSSAASTSSTTTTHSNLQPKKLKVRTNSQPAHPVISNHLSAYVSKNTTGSSYHMDLDSSSSAASTPSNFAHTSQDDEFTVTSGEEETTSFLHETEKKERDRKEHERERKEHETQMKGTLPMSPQSALKSYAPYLSLYERSEILEYPNVYFVGPEAAKAPASPELTGCNYGFDDERGDYKIIPKDHLCYRYEVVDTLGKGSFGQVLKCLDHKTGEYVAVKIIRNKKRFHCQALVEVKILECLNKWDPDDTHNIIHMNDHFYFRNHLCIAFELLSINLYEFIKSSNFQGFSLGLIKRFCVQLLNSLSLLQRHNIVHCDLKPENVLLKHPTKSSIKVIDFGSSCFENEKVYTYIQSRFYRSPEVILGMTYNMAIDMWSLGCILAELYTGYPLFPGENEQEQLACIMEVLGVPEKYLIEKSTRKKLFFDSNGNPRPVVSSKGKRRRPSTKSLANVLKCQDQVFLDFIARCLDWDPEKRMKPDEGLMHEWITEVKLGTRSYFTNYENTHRQASPSSAPASNSAASGRYTYAPLSGSNVVGFCGGDKYDISSSEAAEFPEKKERELSSDGGSNPFGEKRMSSW